MARMPRALAAACLLGLAGARSVSSLDDTSALVQTPPVVPKPIVPAGLDAKLFERLADGEMWRRLQQGHHESHAAQPANLARTAAAAVNELDGNFSKWQQQQPRSLEDVIKVVQKLANPKGGLNADALKGLIQQWQAKQAKDFGGKAKAWLESLAAKAPAPFAPKEMQASWQTQLMHMAGEQLKALGAKAQEDLKKKAWPLQQPGFLNGLVEAIKKYTQTEWKPFVEAVKTMIAAQAKRKQAAPKAPEAMGGESPKAFAAPAAPFPPKMDLKALLEAAAKGNKFIADAVNAVNGIKAKTQMVMPTDMDWFHRIDTNGWKSGAIVKKNVAQGDFYFGGQVKGGGQKAATSVFGGAFGKDGSAASTSVGSVFRPGKVPFVVASHFANPKRRQPTGDEVKAVAAFAGAVQKSFGRQYEKMVTDQIKKGAKFVYLLGLKKARVMRRAKLLWVAAHPRVRAFLAAKKRKVIQAYKLGRIMWWQAQRSAIKKAMTEGPKVQAALAGAKAAWLAESQRQAVEAEASKAAGAKTFAEKKLETFTEYINHPEHVWKEVQRQVGEKLFHEVTHTPNRMEAKQPEAKQPEAKQPEAKQPEAKKAPADGRLETFTEYIKHPESVWKEVQMKLGEELFKQVAHSKSKKAEASAFKTTEPAAAPKKQEPPAMPKLEDIQKFLKDPKKALETAQKKIGEDLVRSFLSKAAAKPAMIPRMSAKGAHLEQSKPAKLAPRAAKEAEEEKPKDEAEAAEQPQDIFGGLFGSDAPFWATVAGALSAAAETAQSAL